MFWIFCYVSVLHWEVFSLWVYAFIPSWTFDKLQSLIESLETKTGKHPEKVNCDTLEFDVSNIFVPHSNLSKLMLWIICFGLCLRVAMATHVFRRLYIMHSGNHVSASAGLNHYITRLRKTQLSDSTFWHSWNGLIALWTSFSYGLLVLGK